MTAIAKRKTRTFLPWVALIGLLVVGGVWFGLPYLTGSFATPQEKESRLIQDWMNSGAEMLPVQKEEDAPFASLLKKPDGQALLVLNKEAASGNSYQAWSVKGSDIESLGVVPLRTLQVNTAGMDALMVSLEGSGGSDTPTNILGDVDLK